jgi:hypothetical protein
MSSLLIMKIGMLVILENALRDTFANIRGLATFRLGWQRGTSNHR